MIAQSPVSFYPGWLNRRRYCRSRTSGQRLSTIARHYRQGKREPGAAFGRLQVTAAGSADQDKLPAIDLVDGRGRGAPRGHRDTPKFATVPGIERAELAIPRASDKNQVSRRHCGATEILRAGRRRRRALQARHRAQWRLPPDATRVQVEALQCPPRRFAARKTFDGLTTVAAGALSLQNNTGLGSTAAGTGTPAFDQTFDASGLTLELAGGTLSLAGGIGVTLGTLHITGDTILDFNNSAGTFLSSAALAIEAGVTITVNNWITVSGDALSSTVWYATGTVNGGSLGGMDQVGGTPLNQILFTSYDGLTTT